MLRKTHQLDDGAWIEQKKKDIYWAIEHDDEAELDRLIDNIYDEGYSDGDNSTEEGEEK